MGRYQKHSNPSDDDLLYIIDRDGGIGGRPKTKVIEWGNLNTGNNASGNDGESAYQIAVRLGFQGTEQQWLNSLKGTDGSLVLPVTTKTTSQDNDFLVLFDSSGSPYKITKANFLAGLSTGGNTGGSNTTNDSLWNQVSLLLKTSSNSFSDAKGNLLTFTGVSSSNTQTRFNQNSIFFSGENSRLAMSVSSNLHLLQGDFSIETWVFPLSNTGFRNIFGQWQQNLNMGGFLLALESGVIRFFFGAFSEGNALVSGTNLALNTWHHISVVRNGDIFTLGINGTAIASNTSSVTRNQINVPISLGNYYNSSGNLEASGATDFHGFIYDLRVTKAARTISLPTAPYPVS